jgi:site-specific recombinase XerD
MFEILFRKPAVVQRHFAAPLANEREQFLSELYRQGGTSRANLVSYASSLIQIVRFLDLQKLRDVKPAEITIAADKWSHYCGRYRQNKAGRYSAPHFAWIARRWLRFHGRLVFGSQPKLPLADKLDEYVQFMTIERGLRPVTVHGRIWQTADFLNWFSRRHRKLSTVSVKDVDTYLAEKASTWTKVTLATRAAVLRAFFRYAEDRDWCSRGIASGIKGPPVRSGLLAGEGPKWSEVQRLLQATRGRNLGTMRARPVLFLFALYGLRRSEVAGLLLNDFDWRNHTFTVRRSKGGGSQQFPIRRELGGALSEYLRLGRPNCSCQNVFVTLNPPYRPVHPVSLSRIVSRRMKRLGIRSGHMGPHSLRHACATQLLQQGISLREIADFLGHRDCRSVGIYAKFDTNGLSAIADLDLGSNL